jgi:hypothetical protein
MTSAGPSLRILGRRGDENYQETMAHFSLVVEVLVGGEGYPSQGRETV